MNRKGFMDRLETLLAVIPEEEREEALQYYTDYFEDAGQENEEQVIKELGSPENVAAMIKADLKDDSAGNGEFTENGYSDARFEQRDNPVPRPNRYKRAEGGYTYRSTEGTGSNSRNSYSHGSYNANGYSGNPYHAEEEYREQPRTSKTLKIVLIILIAIVVLPFAFPILIGAAGIVIGLVCATFGLFAGLVIGSVALMGAGFAIFFLGLTKILSALPVALLTSGSGLIIFVLGLIATIITVKLCIIVYPVIIRGVVTICRWPFHRKAVS